METLKKKIIKVPLVGNMSGDGHLRFTHKDKIGKPKLGTNALYAMTLNSHEYLLYFLVSNLF